MPYKDPARQREFQRLWMAKRRSDWIAQNGPCVTCGSSENLEVDHIDPKTKCMSPRAIWSRRAEDRMAELAKCQVLCRGCHSAKTRVLLSVVPRGPGGRILPRETWEAAA